MDNITTHQAKYLANHLTRRLYTAKNNQMEALFDFKFPLSKGAGIILSQHLAGYKRKLLIISLLTSANLEIKQMELFTIN